MGKKMKILITGGTGMVGSAFERIETRHEIVRVGSKDYNLLRSLGSTAMMLEHKPDAVIHLAARVGGVKANTDFVADFFDQNIKINMNVLRSAHLSGVPKVLSLLSTCIYPDDASYPLTEEQINDSPPHQSNFGYAYAKRMLDVQSRAYRQQYGCNFITAIPNNLYGENDNYNLQDGHVIPALMRKIWEAKLKEAPFVMCWGDGSAFREFTYAPDIASILLFLAKNYDEATPINIGNTEEHSIKEVVNILCELLEYDGEIIWDTSQPTGQVRKPSSNKKLLDLGWKTEDYTPLKAGLIKSYKWFKINYPQVRGI